MIEYVVHRAGIQRRRWHQTGRVSGRFRRGYREYPEASGAGEELPGELRVQTAKGIHHYYPYSGDKPMRNKVRVRFDGRQIDVDIRAEGGYVVAPGSVHPNGHIYEREGTGWRWS